ncbi:monoglyceride lipase [Acrasis kona]|uniref:Monoglyceride lipase n=1 Tax=Acrasis kona TaxID=1008807 RepID=A0AAW2YKP2_9EUKA
MVDVLPPADSVVYQESTHKTVDGREIYYCESYPKGGVHRAAVAVVHGLGEHCGRYKELSSTLNNIGVSVHYIDLRGHGKSDGPRVYVNRFDEFLDDVDVLLGNITKNPENTGKPVFLFGHSMGGCISALYVLERLKNREYSQSIKGLILSSPGLAFAEGNTDSCTVFIGKILSVIFPNFPLKGIDVNNLSRDPECIKAITNDPLAFHGKVPIRTLTEFLGAQQKIENSHKEVTIPLYIFHGTLDKLTCHKASKIYHSGIASTDKTIKIYEGHFHECMNDIEKHIVFKGIVDWIEERV